MSELILQSPPPLQLPGSRFCQNGYETLDELWNRRWDVIDPRLKELAGPSEEQFLLLCDKTLRGLVDSAEPEVIGALDDLLEEYNIKKDEQDRVRRLLVNLQEKHQEQRQNYEQQAGKLGEKFYWGLYGLLVGGSMIVYAYTFPMIAPEQPRIIGVVQSAVMAAPSFMISSWYKRSTNKNRILSLLEGSGIASSITTFIAGGIARSLRYKIMEDASSGSFLAGTTSSSPLELSQMIFAGLTFIAAVITEIAFGSRILIHLKKIQEARAPLKETAEDLAKVNEEAEQLKKDCLTLRQVISQIQAYQTVSQSWIAAKLVQYQAWYRMHREKLRRKLITEVNQKTVDELLSLIPQADHTEDTDND